MDVRTIGWFQPLNHKAGEWLIGPILYIYVNWFFSLAIILLSHGKRAVKKYPGLECQEHKEKARANGASVTNEIAKEKQTSYPWEELQSAASQSRKAFPPPGQGIKVLWVEATLPCETRSAIFWRTGEMPRRGFGPSLTVSLWPLAYEVLWDCFFILLLWPRL